MFPTCRAALVEETSKPDAYSASRRETPYRQGTKPALPNAWVLHPMVQALWHAGALYHPGRWARPDKQLAFAGRCTGPPQQKWTVKRFVLFLKRFPAAGTDRYP